MPRTMHGALRAAFLALLAAPSAGAAASDPACEALRASAARALAEARLAADLAPASDDLSRSRDTLALHAARARLALVELRCGGALLEGLQRQRVEDLRRRWAQFDCHRMGKELALVERARDAAGGDVPAEVQARLDFYGPRVAACIESGEAAAELRLPTADGGVVHASVHGLGESGVVLAHGGRFTKESWDETSAALAALGHRVLAIDFRGRGRSRGPGGSERGGEHHDVLAAVRHLRATGAETVAVVGASFGGGAAAQAAVEAGPGEIDALFLLAHSPIERPERMQGRKLFVVARDDVRGGGVRRLDEIREQFEAAPEPKQLVVLDDAAHAQFLFDSDQAERLRDLIFAFVAEELPDPVAFWDRPRRGANLFNRVESRERLEAAAAAGIEFVRIAPDKWGGEGRDFLLGDADHFVGIPAGDLERLRAVLDDARAAGLRVVLTMLSLPGARWRQHGDGEDDGRLWRDEGYRAQAVAFWSELAAALRDHRALVGYDLLNEPHPARTLAGLDDPEAAAYARWWADAVGTPADLNAFYLDVVAAVRAVDPATPIVLESPAHAARAAMRCLRPVDDERVLYSFHFYEPWLYTARRVNEGRYRYPDRMPVGWREGVEPWPRDRIAERMEVVAEWSAEHGIPPTRILLGELGVSRSVGGAAEYLADVIEAADARAWHWAFYSWREDTWSEMDYEGGPAAVYEALRSRLTEAR